MKKLLVTIVLVSSSVCAFAMDFSVKFINNTQEAITIAPQMRTNTWNMRDLDKPTTIPAKSEVILQTSADSTNAWAGLAAIYVQTGNTYLGEVIEIWQNYSGTIKANKNQSTIMIEKPWRDSSLIYYCGIGTTNNKILTTLNEDGSATVTFTNPQNQVTQLKQTGILPW